MNQAWLFNDLLGCLADSWEGLADKPEETPLATLRALWWAAAGVPCSAERAGQGDLPVLSELEVTQLQELIAKRVSGVPLSHLSGRQRFMNLEMVSGPEALIPRKETEILGTKITQSTLNEIEQLIVYIKKYHRDSTEKIRSFLEIEAFLEDLLHKTQNEKKAKG